MKIRIILLVFLIFASLVFANGNNSTKLCLNALEINLLETDSIKIDFNITATGAIEANAKGTMLLKSYNRVSFSAKGEFTGEPLNLELLSNGSKMDVSNSNNKISVQTPPYLNQGSIISLTRM